LAPALIVRRVVKARQRACRREGKDHQRRHGDEPGIVVDHFGALRDQFNRRPVPARPCNNLFFVVTFVGTVW